MAMGATPLKSKKEHTSSRSHFSYITLLLSSFVLWGVVNCSSTPAQDETITNTEAVQDSGITLADSSTDSIPERRTEQDPESKEAPPESTAEKPTSEIDTPEPTVEREVTPENQPAPFLGKVLSKQTTAEGYIVRKIQFGKYWRGEASNPDRTQNILYLYSPPASNSKQPIVVHIHGGGFTSGGPLTQITGEIVQYLRSGIHFASLDYRQVQHKYFYFDQDGKAQEEEFIKVSPDGVLSVDASQKMSDYKVLWGRQEFTTKCVYDAIQQMEYLTREATNFNIDLSRVGFIASSAGGLEANYLTWVYPKLKLAKYTPVSSTLYNMQLNYPVQNAGILVFDLWIDELGGNELLSTHLDQGACATVLGNPQCNNPQNDPARQQVCNASWNTTTTNQYCGATFGKVTFQELQQTQVFPSQTPHQKGLNLLWNISGNMQAYQPKPFALYVVNTAGAKEAADHKKSGDFVHHALYAKKYGEFAEKANINYAVGYPAFENMKSDSKTQTFSQQNGPDLYYKSNFGFLSNTIFVKIQRRSGRERLLFHCLAMKLNCP